MRFTLFASCSGRIQELASPGEMHTWSPSVAVTLHGSCPSRRRRESRWRTRHENRVAPLAGSTELDHPLYAAMCRSLERKSLIFLGLGFFFEPEGRGFESLPARHSSIRGLRSSRALRATLTHLPTEACREPTEAGEVSPVSSTHR